jgi:hypothetical protein
MKKEDMSFFVEVKEPYELKKRLLESSKDIVEALHRYEKFKTIREEKIENVTKLRAIMRDLTRLSSKLKAALPQTKATLIRYKKVLPVKKKKGKKRAEKTVKIEPKKERTELENLEIELKSIENKLKNLS